MTDPTFSNLPPSVLFGAAAVVALLLAWLVYRLLHGKPRTVTSVIESIAFDYVSDLVIPKADEGEIHIDHLLLTAQGLLVLDVKDVQGIVFGGDKLQDWTVMASDRRYTFANPQHALYDRIAAVRQIVRQVPVSGRLLFIDGADFTKGVPDLVCTLDDLERTFGDSDATGAAARIDAFKPHWEKIRAQARQGVAPSRRRRRASA